MKTPGFLQGVGLALLISLSGSALFTLLQSTTGTESALRLVITLSAAAYLLFLVRWSSARVGKVSTVLAWCTISGFAWTLQPDLLVYLLIHMGLLWLVRSVYFYRSALSALMDLGLQGLSLAATVWALQATGSLLLCLWSFFLVQALFVAIPPGGFRLGHAALDSAGDMSGFMRAHRSAEAALRRLCSSL